jgi:hypothetical protein
VRSSDEAAWPHFCFSDCTVNAVKCLYSGCQRSTVLPRKLHSPKIADAELGPSHKENPFQVMSRRSGLHIWKGSSKISSHRGIR